MTPEKLLTPDALLEAEAAEEEILEDVVEVVGGDLGMFFTAVSLD